MPKPKVRHPRKGDRHPPRQQLQPQPAADPSCREREQLAKCLLQTYDELLQPLETLSAIDKDRIVGLTYKQEWESYEKLLNNLIFRFYRQILVDEDVKTGKKLIYFVTALKNLPKSFKNENNMETGKDQIQAQGDAEIGIEI